MIVRAIDVTVAISGEIECISYTDPESGRWHSLYDSKCASSGSKTVRLTGNSILQPAPRMKLPADA